MCANLIPIFYRTIIINNYYYYHTTIINFSKTYSSRKLVLMKRFSGIVCKPLSSSILKKIIVSKVCFSNNVFKYFIFIIIIILNILFRYNYVYHFLQYLQCYIIYNNLCIYNYIISYSFSKRCVTEKVPGSINVSILAEMSLQVSKRFNH